MLIICAVSRKMSGEINWIIFKKRLWGGNFSHFSNDDVKQEVFDGEEFLDPHPPLSWSFAGGANEQ